METWYSNMPVVTRLHATGLLFVHVCVHFGFIDKYHLYFDPTLVFHKHQFWRIITAFLYYSEGDGKISWEFFSIFKMIVFSYYLERECFLERTADFVWVYFLSIVASTLHTLPFVAAELHAVFFAVWLLHMTKYSTSKKVTILVWMLNIGLASRAYYYSIYGHFTALTFGILYHFLENVLPTWSISRGVRLFKSPDFV